MEATTSQSCFFILTTYEDGKTNHYYDSTFRLRAPFKPNANGQYKVELLECLFHNNEATLMKDTDWFEFEVYFKDGTHSKDRWEVQTDIYTFDYQDDINIYNALKGLDNKSNRTIDNNIQGIYLYRGDGLEMQSTDHFGVSLTMQVRLKNTVNPANVASVKMRYSMNFGYLLNNIRGTAYDLTGETVTGHNDYFNFNFYSLRFAGPLLYVLKTPLRATVPTYNANNQAYNIIASSYNTMAYHNQPTQLPSTMEIVTNDLSNLRMELVTDQMEPVYIHCPMYIVLKVTNE